MCYISTNIVCMDEIGQYTFIFIRFSFWLCNLGCCSDFCKRNSRIIEYLTYLTTVNGLQICTKCVRVSVVSYMQWDATVPAEDTHPPWWRIVDSLVALCVAVADFLKEWSLHSWYSVSYQFEQLQQLLRIEWACAELAVMVWVNVPEAPPLEQDTSKWLANSSLHSTDSSVKSRNTTTYSGRVHSTYPMTRVCSCRQ